ncbi:MAG: hypothetical protein CMJ90_11030 [Planctomycetes bacterium]|nr:hypothetical protein [Planctomycetota bacterium]
MVTAPRRKGSADEPWVFGATDESSKIHLAKLIEWDQARPGAAQEILLRLPGMTDDVADAILDWIDADSEPRPAGAEVDTYAEFSVPISPRNGLPPNLEELLLVQGVEEFVLFGESRIVVQKVDDTPANRLDEFRPWVDYLTVYSGCRNESQSGLPRVFINQSNLFSLHQQLTRRMPIAWANFIILLRQYGPGDAGESSLGPELLTLDFTQPAEFTIDNMLDVIDSAVSVTQNDKAVRVPSPFSSDLLLMQHQLTRLFDQVTSDSNPFSIGQVNINMAPEEVLLAVPGIDEDLADKILAAQVNASDSESRRNHPVWLLTEGLVNIPTMKNLLPHLNTGGDVFRAEFWGRSDDRHGIYRCEAVVDATGLSARQTYLRELEVGKWPFLENQAQEKE